MSADLDDTALQAEFARRKTNQWRAVGLCLLAMVASLFIPPEVIVYTHDLAVPSLLPMVVIGLMIPPLIAMIFYSRHNWRCPACGHRFPAGELQGGKGYYERGARCGGCRRLLSPP